MNRSRLAFFSASSAIFVALLSLAPCVRAAPPTAKPSSPKAQKPAEKAAGAQKTPKKVTKKKAKAGELIHDMERAVAYIGKAEKNNLATDKSLRSRKSLAFKQDLAATSKLVTELDKQVAAKDNNAHVTARKIEKAIASVDTTYKFSGIKTPAVAEGVQKLKATWAVYDRAFESHALVDQDPAGATKPLDEKQRAEMEALKGKTEGLIKLLMALEAKLVKSKGLDHELTHLIAEARSLQNAKATFGALHAVIERLLEIEGKYRGLYSYVVLVYPSFAKEFETLNTYWTAFAAEIARYHDEMYVSYDVSIYDKVEVEYTAESVEVDISEAEVPKFETYVEIEVLAEASEPYSEKQAAVDDVGVDPGKVHAAVTADGSMNDAPTIENDDEAAKFQGG